MRLRAPHPNLGRLFSAQPRERLAAIDFGAGARAITYGELDDTADAAAHALTDLGLKAGDRLGILSLNRIEFIEALFGAMRAGIIPVLANVRLPADKVRALLDFSDVQLALAETPFAASGTGETRKVLTFEEDWPALIETARAKGPFEAIVPDGEQVSMQLFTSGSTGTPKGVMLHHPGQIWATEVLVEHRGLTADDIAILSAPSFHKNAMVAIKTAFLVGATLAILPKFDVEATVAAIRDHGVNILTGVPTMMAMLSQRTDLFESVNTDHVRVVSMGSAPASDALIADIKRTFPNAEIHLNYGTTEGGPNVTGWYHPDGIPRPPGSVGWPLPDTELKFIGGPHAREGELWTRNPGVAAGYHKLPEKTAEKFVDGWYATGDVMRLDDDGWLYFVGRTDDMFVVSGENVYPQEVETLLEAHQDVAQAVVIPIAHNAKGMVPVAFVKPASGRTIYPAALKQYTIDNGPAYAHPRQIIVVAEMPLTGTNKVDKPALKALLSTPEHA